MNLFDENAALEHVKALAFKRKASTEGERKSLNYIQKQLDKKGISNSLEPFFWSPSMSILMKLGFLILMSFVLIYQVLLVLPTLLWVILILDGSLLIILFFGSKVLLDMTRIIYLGKKRESENLIAKIDSRSNSQKKPVIIFSAHYDSISTKYSMKTTKILYGSAALLLLTYLFLTIVLALWGLLNLLFLTKFNYIFLILRTISFTIGIIVIVEIILILFNKRTNESLGSIDNASGTAILIELASLFKDNSLENLNLIFLWCGAEEWGLWGSKQFCAKRFDELNATYDLDKSYNINIDMVGTYIGLVDKTGIIKKRKMNEFLNDVLEAEGKQLNVSLKRASIPIGAGSDHMSFRSWSKKRSRKLQVCCFLSHKDSQFIHSSKDTPEKCSTKNLSNCITLCYNTAKSLDLRTE